MSNTDTDTPNEYAESRRYVCTSCDTVVRARWSQWGDGYPGYFSVGCDCTIVPVVPEMSQAETPDEWRVERPECCRGVDVKDLEECYVGVSDYRCPGCGATYRWDGTMSTAPECEEQPDPPDDQQLLTDGGTDQHVESAPREELRTCGKCGEEYEPYTYFVTKNFNGLVDRMTIDREYGNICIDCRRELMDGRDWGIFES